MSCDISSSLSFQEGPGPSAAFLLLKRGTTDYSQQVVGKAAFKSNAVFLAQTWSMTREALRPSAGMIGVETDCSDQQGSLRNQKYSPSFAYSATLPKFRSVLPIHTWQNWATTSSLALVLLRLQLHICITSWVIAGSITLNNYRPVLHISCHSPPLVIDETRDRSCNPF